MYALGLGIHKPTFPFQAATRVVSRRVERVSVIDVIVGPRLIIFKDFMDLVPLLAVHLGVGPMIILDGGLLIYKFVV